MVLIRAYVYGTFLIAMMIATEGYQEGETGTLIRAGGIFTLLIVIALEGIAYEVNKLRIAVSSGSKPTEATNLSSDFRFPIGSIVCGENLAPGDDFLVTGIIMRVMEDRYILGCPSGSDFTRTPCNIIGVREVTENDLQSHTDEWKKLQALQYRILSGK